MIYIGIDDTDNPECGGTGRVARGLAALLRERYPVLGVSRHQLLVDPRVPYTSNNSCNVIHVDAPAGEEAALARRTEPLLRERCLPGSDPGLCVAGPEVAGHPFGRAVQERLSSQAEALEVAAALGVILKPLGGSEDGIIGALAGVILAAGGSDGRFVDVGRARELDGIVPLAAVLAAGIARVSTPTGEPVTAGEIDTNGGRIRPVLRGGQPVLLVDRIAPGRWRAIEQGKKHAPTGGHSQCRS